MKQEFLEFLNKLMEAAPDIVAEFKTKNIDTYIKALEGAEEINKPDMTFNDGEKPKVVTAFFKNDAGIIGATIEN